MRIAFTHNVQRTASEAEAEFDSPETIEAIAGALAALGHEVVPIDVDQPLARLVATLEGLAPDIVFNTAEGWRGRFREAFYPALFESLGLPFVGSDAHSCALTLDKHASKMMVAPAGVPVAGSVLIDALDAAIPADMTFPVIVKPNFEGSSKGIDDRAVVASPQELAARVADSIGRFPEGVLVESFVGGWDVVVPYIEGVGDEGGVLTPAEYRFTVAEENARAHGLYDFGLKHDESLGVEVRVPAVLPDDVRERLMAWSRTIVRTLNVRDMARMDWRVDADGNARFLEINALPSLEPGASIYESAKLSGKADMAATLEAILRSACARQGVVYEARKKGGKQAASRSARVGLVYNLKRVKPRMDGELDNEAEFDSQSTIDAIRDAIASFGHEVVPLEADRTLLTRIGEARVDVVFNIAEGMRGRGREALVPAILDLLDIPYTGSDAATLAVTLDKALAKRLVRESGVLTPDFFVMTSAKQKVPAGLGWPLIVKPVAEGSSKGVVPTSVVENEASLREVAGEIIARYQQGALVEAFLPGREFTLGMLGGARKPRVLPAMEIVHRSKAKHPIYSFEHKQAFTEEVVNQVPAEVDATLGRALEDAARRCWDALGCRDVARVDLRLDVQGRVSFIECNPLPGLTPEFSDLALIATGARMGYRELIGEILAPALGRLRQQRRRERHS